MQTEQDLCELQLPSGHKLLVLSPLETSMNEEVDGFVQCKSIRCGPAVVHYTSDYVSIF